MFLFVCQKLLEKSFIKYSLGLINLGKLADWVTVKVKHFDLELVMEVPTEQWQTGCLRVRGQNNSRAPAYKTSHIYVERAPIWASERMSVLRSV